MNPEMKMPTGFSFRRRFVERFGTQREALSAYGYDAANLVVDAVGRAGLNRVRIRRVLMGVRAHRASQEP